jgi:hypothetical protein
MKGESMADEQKTERESAVSGNGDRLHTLYVVFHGEVVFFDSGKSDENIQAMAPEMDIHQYLAGAWLGENWIPKGLTLGLSGVVPGKATFTDDQHKDLTLVFKGARHTNTRAHMQLDLPRPYEITSGKRMTVDKCLATVDGKCVPIPPDSQIAIATVFHYRLIDGTTTGSIPRLYVKGGSADPEYVPHWAAGESKYGFCVLHVYAEADCVPGTMHIQMASQASAALLGITAEFKQPGIWSTFHPIRPENVPPGLLPHEVNMTLADRSDAIRLVGQEIQQDPTACIRWSPPPFAAGGNSACGHIVGVPSGT